MAASWTQAAFRFRNDNGNETTATWRQNQSVNDSIAVDTNFRIRFEIQETGGSAGNNKVWQLQYNRNSAGWVNVTNASSVVRASPSPNLTDAANLTNQLTAGTGTFQGATGFDEGNGQAGGASMDVAASGHAEAEYSVQIRSADVVNGDTIGLRVTDAGTALAVYSANAVATVIAAVTGDFNRTEAADIAALTGGVLITGDIAATETSDVAAADGTLSRTIGKITQLNAALYPSRRYTSFIHTQATTGDITATEVNDGIATPWTGAVEWLTSIALVEAPDVVAFDGSVIAEGDLAATDTNDTIAVIGFVGSGANLAATDAADVLAATGDVSASAKKTQLNAAFRPSRRYGNFIHPLEVGTGTMAATEAVDVAESTGSVVLIGNLAAVESPDSFIATSAVRGRFTQLNAALWPSRRYSSFYLRSGAGLLDVTEARDAAAFIGAIPTVTTGDLAATDPETFIGLVDENGNHIIDGSGNWIGAYYCADTAAATGTVGALEVIFGDLASTEAIDVTASTGGIIATATMAATEARDSPLFTGVLGADLGDLAATEQADTFVSTAISQWLATFVATEPTDQASATATVQWANNFFAATEAPDVFAADGSVLVEGYLDTQEEEDICRIGLQPSFNLFVDCYETEDAKNNIVPIIMVAELGIGVVPVRFTEEGYNVVPVKKQLNYDDNVVPVCEVQ